MMKKLLFQLRLIVAVFMIVVGKSPKATAIAAVSLVSYLLGYDVLSSVVLSVFEFLNDFFNGVCMLLIVSLTIYKVLG